MKSVLVTDHVHQILLDNFTQAGFMVSYEPEFMQADVLECIQFYDVLIVNSKIQVNKEMMDLSTRLKVVGRLGSGREIIDHEYARERGVHFFNSPEGNCDAVAEHAMGLLLSLINNITVAFMDVKSGNWNREANRGYELKGKTVGIYGYGHTGRAFAERLRSYGVRVLAYDKYQKDYGDDIVQESTPADIFEKADILSLHLPLTDETRYLVDRNFLSSFSKPFWLINTSRGQVLRTSVLLDMIESGRVLGAGLDVLENENPSTFSEVEWEIFNRIIGKKNVIVTPHIAGWTHESKQKLAAILSDKIIRSFENHNAVNI